MVELKVAYWAASTVSKMVAALDRQRAVTMADLSVKKTVQVASQCWENYTNKQNACRKSVQTAFKKKLIYYKCTL